MNNIYRRPMFQNPQQRAGGGIMAGVAPINMSNGGDPNDTWAKAIPSFLESTLMMPNLHMMNCLTCQLLVK